MTVAPGKTLELLLQNDLSKEPGFVGCLAIMVELFEKDELCGKLELRVTATKELFPKSMENTTPIQPNNDSHAEPTLAPPR